jgi:hypothetical protein
LAPWLKDYSNDLFKFMQTTSTTLAVEDILAKIFAPDSRLPDHVKKAAGVMIGYLNYPGNEQNIEFLYNIITKPKH